MVPPLDSALVDLQCFLLLLHAPRYADSRRPLRLHDRSPPRMGKWKWSVDNVHILVNYDDHIRYISAYWRAYLDDGAQVVEDARLHVVCLHYFDFLYSIRYDVIPVLDGNFAIRNTSGDLFFLCSLAQSC